MDGSEMTDPGEKPLGINRPTGSSNNHNYRYRRFFSLFLGFAIVIITAIFILSSPLFTIKDVLVTGNAIVSADTIKEDIGLFEQRNIFAFRSGFAKQSLLKNPYIKSVEIEKQYPDKVIITVKERKPRAYVEFKNIASYLLIDETGMVLDSVSFAKEKLPMIVGLTLTDVIVGQPLAAEDTTAFENVVLLSNLFDKYSLTGDIRVEVSAKEDMHLYIDQIDVLFGAIEDADYKISTVKAVLPNIPKGARGFLDVKDCRKNAVFRYLK